MPYGYGYGYGYGGFGLDSGYILVLIAMALTFAASAWVQSTFSKYNQVPSSKSAAEAARHVLDRNGLQNVRIEHVSGSLTDHYDPKDNVVRLSDATYSSRSVGAVGVACHEVGHAIQHATGYVPARIRTAIVPVVNLCSQLSIPLMLAGLFLNLMGLFRIGIVLFAASLVFALVTLPVEINASRRAIRTMESDSYFTSQDIQGSRKVLTAAASTYLASAFLAFAQLFRFIGLANRNQRH